MSDVEFRTVGVVGLGTMGAGIAEVFARHGFAVVGVEPTEDALARGRGHLEKSLARAVSRGKLDEAESAAILGRVTMATSYEALSACDLVVEAIPERLEWKREVFTRLDAVCPPHAVLATNTSSLSVTEIAACTSRPSRVLGMHFFNPAPVMRLVEVISTVVADAEVVAAVEDLARSLGKIVVSVGDRAGFVVNSLLFGYLNHAVTLLEAGHVSRDELDVAMKVGAGFPMGPLTLLDLIGLDTGVEILDAMYAETGDRLHKAAPLLRRMVAAGLVGRKGGRGFYTYGGEQEPALRAYVAPESVTVGVLGSKEETEPLVSALAAAGVDVVGSDDQSRLGSREVILVVADDVPVLGFAAVADDASRILGVRWHGDDEGLRLIELARTALTDEMVVGFALSALGKLDVPVVECGDRAGLVVDRLLHAYLGDAVRMVEAGYASIDDVDAAMKLGCGYPAGPFETLDAVGLPGVVQTLERLYEETREPSFAPPPLLVQLAFAGRSFR